MADRKKDHDHKHGHDANRDPITGEPGSHPIGTGTGAAGGALAGAAIGGAVGGPVGAAIGGTIGAISGGAAGHGVAEGINPTEEDRYWRENYSTRTYTDENRDYNVYQPAYRYGWESRARLNDRDWTEVESDLGRDWDNYRGRDTDLDWERAKHAARDAWARVDERNRGTTRR